MIEIFLDIETLPTPREDIRERVTKEVAPPGNYKKQETINTWWAAEGDAKKAEAISRTALDGTWGEVLCIGFAVDDGPVQVLTRTDNIEATVLAGFGESLHSTCCQVIKSGEMWPTIATWIGHNIIDFDLRFLWQRYRILGMRLPFILPITRDHGRVFDTMKEWAGWKDRVSQSDLELAFGLTRDDPLPNGGADVWQAYQEGRTDDIRMHCAEDIRLLREIHRRMTQ